MILNIIIEFEIDRAFRLNAAVYWDATRIVW
jgi:hypothetical protein